MARKSRSTQRGSGVGTRSGTGGGPSKGGSRSSAGTGGGSKSGGNKSGSGKKSGGTKSGGTKSGGGPSKGPSGGGTKKGGKHQSGPPSKTPAPKKTIQQKKADNIQSMRDRARKRHETFKETGFQTKGGRFAKDTDGSITGKAGKVYDTRKKAVQDAARKRHQKFVQDRKDKAVDKKSAKLAAATGIPSGDKLLAGSFGISAAGREQAAANRMAARQTMNLNTGLNVGSKAKFKDGQRIASNYNDLPSGLQNILQNQLKSFEKQGQGERELKRLKNMYPGFMPRADAGGVFGTLASLNPAATLGNLVLGAPASAAQFTSATGDEGAAGTPQSGGLSIGQNQEATSNPLSRALQIQALGALDAATFNLGDFDGLGGQTEFGRQLGDSINAAKTIRNDLGALTGDQGIVGTVKSIVNNRNDLMKLAQNKDVSLQDIADTTTYARNLQDLGPLKATANLSADQAEGIGQAYNFAKDTDLYNNALTKFGGEGFPSAVNQFADYVGENYNKLSDDVAANRRVVSDMMIGNDSRLDVPKAIAYQYQDQVNPNLRDLGMAGFQTAVQNAMLPNAPKLKGINKDERGIVGSLGNFLLSNDAQNIATKNLPGTTNALSLASNIIGSGSDPTSPTYKESQRFLRTAGIGGPTPESILKGITGIGGRKGSNKPGANLLGAKSTKPAPTLVPEEILEFLEPTVPTTDTSEMSLPEFVDPTDAYNDALNEFLYNPNYFPEVQQYQKKPVKTFAQTFNRDYF